MPDLGKLRQASFRNVPFAVEAFGGAHGRRVRVHEYPDKDIPWSEDLGRKARTVRVRGFLLENSRVYGGGDVGLQLGRMIEAAETKGPGPLIHPILGQLNVNCLTLNHEAAQSGASQIEISFDFVESGVRKFPTISTSTGAAVTGAAAAAQSAAGTSFAARARQALPLGASVVQAAGGVATGWVKTAQTLGRDATSLLNLAARLTGNNGRYFSGANRGGLSGSILSGVLSTVGVGSGAASGLQPGNLAQLIARATGLRANIGSAASQLSAVVKGLGL